MLYPLHWLLSLLASVLRLGAGRAPGSAAATGTPDTLYEFEACPFCRIAREAISEAGRTVRVKPCPKRGERFRPEVTALGGKAQFPYLIDAETGDGQYESGDIARHVAEASGRGRPFIHKLGPLNTILSQYAVLFRLLSGNWARPSKAPDQPLEYFGAERSPGGRLVKEQLCTLELEHIWHPQAGRPMLRDPNTGTERKGGAAIRAYLKSEYAA